MNGTDLSKVGNAHPNENCYKPTTFSKQSLIYLITVNYNAADLIAQLLRSIHSQLSESIAWTLLIVNNSPADQEIFTLQSDRVKIFEAGTNLGFGVACNLALNWVFEQNRSAIVWLINPDTQLTADALIQATTIFTTHSDCSILGTLVTEPTGKIWFGGGKFDPKTGEISAIDLFADHNSGDYFPCDWVTGCSLLLNLDRFPTCPQFDPRYFCITKTLISVSAIASKGILLASRAELK